MIPPGLKVAIVNGICVPHDAISASIVESVHALESASPGGVTLFTYRCDVGGLRSVNVPNLGALLLHPDFLSADVLLFHFGIHYDLFDALILGNGRARRFARFHNVTPREFLPERLHAIIDRSLAQVENMAWADHVWCDSEFNRRVLLEYGLEPGRVSTLPLPVAVPEHLPRARPPRGAPVILLYLGRIVPAKGVHDLVRAVLSMRDRGVDGFRVLIAGNADFSDAEFAKALQDEIRARDAGDFVTFCGQVSEAEKDRLLETAHALVIPSYHEGFCMPVVEALGRGCFVIGYASGNVPFIANGFGNLRAPGDVDGLSRTLEGFVLAVKSSGDPILATDGQGELPFSAFGARAHEYASGFAPARFREQLVAAVAGQLTH